MAKERLNAEHRRSPMRALKLIAELLIFIAVMLSVILATVIVTLTFPIWGPFMYSKREFLYAYLDKKNR
jgi:hypothetical protein